jgi:hypothetical protein
MPRRDWNAKLDREYERLYEQLARAGAARLGPRRPERSLHDVRPRRPRPIGGPAHRLIRIACSLALLPRAAPPSDRGPTPAWAR